MAAVVGPLLHRRQFWGVGMVATPTDFGLGGCGGRKGRSQTGRVMLLYVISNRNYLKVMTFEEK